MDCPCPRHSPHLPTTADVGPAVVGEIDGRPVIGLSRLTNGQVMCQLCFGYFWLCELNIIDADQQIREDVCIECAQAEQRSAPDPT